MNSSLQSEEKRIADLYQNELQKVEKMRERQRNIRLAISLVCFFIIFCVIFGAVVSSSSRVKNAKKEQYILACSLYNDAKYIQALEYFEDLGDYEDAQRYVIKINDMYDSFEKIYENAGKYYANEEYIKAAEEFWKVIDYKDANTLFEQCNEMLIGHAKEKRDINDYSAAIVLLKGVSGHSEYAKKASELCEEIYVLQNKEYIGNALALKEEEQFDDALELLRQIPSSSICYAEAFSLMEEINGIKMAKEHMLTYEKACELYKACNYAEAQRLFLLLGKDYSDVKDYIENIGNIFYKQATDCVSVKDYVGAYNAAKYINESPEWSEYKKAIELIDSCKSSYISNVRNNAESKYKAEGFSVMKEYLASSEVKNLMQKEDYEDLIEKYGKVKVTELTPFYVERPNGKNRKYETGTWTDMMGVEHKNSITGNFVNKYRIDGEFRKIEGTLFKVAESEWTGAILKILDEDNNCLEQFELSKENRMQSFSVDIAGLDCVSISFEGRYYTYGTDYFLGAVADFVFVR